MKLKLALFYLLCMVPWLAHGQSFEVTGTVTNAKDGTPVIGATVQTQDMKATSTLRDGTYRLNVNPGDILTASFLGMSSQSFTVGTQTTVNFQLEDDFVGLDDVVVIGYGTVRKRDLTGAVGQVKADDIMKGNPATSINSALQGKLAGVQVNQLDGAPGGGISITIRGSNSFSTNTQPLYVVDGLPYGGGSAPSTGQSTGGQDANPLSNLNPHDIESIEVLKDASATAIYGSRGANGVVIITTKRGKSGKTNVSFSSNFSFSQVGKKIKMLDAETYANYINEQNVRFYASAYPDEDPFLPYRGEWYYDNDINGNIIASSGKYSPSPADFRNPGPRYDEYGNMDIVGSNNWQDAIFRTGYTQEYNLSISGANEKGGYLISGNYVKQTGIIMNSDYRRYSLRSNIYRHLFPWLEVGLNMNYSNTLTNFVNTSANGESGALIYSALVFPPVYGEEINDEGFTELIWLAANPYVYAREAFDQYKGNNINTQAYVNVNIWNGLSFRQNIGLGYNNGFRYTYYNRKTMQGYQTNGKGGQGDNWGEGITSESLLNYNKTFNEDHTVNAVVGMTYEQSNWANKYMSGQNFPSDLPLMWDMGSALEPDPLVSGRGKNQLASILARMNYSYKGKYMGTFTYRRDGSSVFVEGNKFANFFSGALAWRISEENFVKDLNFFEDLKLRLSYGETGNQGISTYSTLPIMMIANYPPAGSLTGGYAEVTWRGPVNKDLKWETTSQFDVGLDISILRGKINLTADYYYKKTRDLLQSTKIPSSTGFTQMAFNKGWVKNKGLELAGNFQAFSRKDFGWSIDANISFNKNLIGGLDGDQYANALWSGLDFAFIQRNGMPIGAIYGFVEDGFYNNLAEVRADPQYADESKVSDAYAKSLIGEIKYRDLDGDGEITNADRTIIGDTNPDFIYGVTNNFRYKNFNLSFFLQGTYGNDILNANLANRYLQNTGIGNIPQKHYDLRWTEENMHNAKYPKALSSGSSREFKFSDRYVEDGSYLRLKNITLGYTFFPKWNGISSLNVYVSATNLFTITGYSWYDPDVNALGSDSSRRGVDMFSYPSSRTYSLGFKIDF